MTTLRILCLHDNHSNALELKNEFHILGKKLYEQHQIDFVYVNGPIIESSVQYSTTTTTTSTTSAQTQQQQDNYIWYEKRDSESSEKLNVNDNTNGETDLYEQQDMLVDNATTAISHINNSTQQQQYIGLDASLMLLRQIWTSSSSLGTFWGILGIGSGAAMAAIFVTLLESELLAYHNAINNNNTTEDDYLGFTSGQRLPLPPALPQLIILISGETLLSVDEPLLLSDYYNNDDNNNNTRFILHLVDSDITDDQELLLRQFPQGCQIEHRRQRLPQQQGLGQGRQVFSRHDLNIIGRFICQRKKDIFTCHYNDDDDVSIRNKNDNNNNAQILALQTALCNAEQDATNYISESIALQPPSALMAIIHPKMVAGWNGNRRPQPEGGGAPCPIEFLHRSKRNTSNKEL